MSRLLLPGHDPTHRLVIGVDTALPHPSFFGQLLTEADEDENEEAEDEPPIWVGGSVPPLVDLQHVVTALQPYGEIPLPLQVQLLDELDQVMPLPLREVGRQLAAICQQAPEARLVIPPDLPERAVLILTEQGWQIHPWHDPDGDIPHLLFPGQDALLNALSGFTNSPAVLLFLHDEAEHMPVTTILTSGMACGGPTALANEDRGLSPIQVQVLARSVFWVPPALRDRVSTLWYRALQRGWDEDEDEE